MQPPTLFATAQPRRRGDRTPSDEPGRGSRRATLVAMRQDNSSDTTTSSITTGPTSSSSNTNPSMRVENGVKIPVLAAGTYHRKQPGPILSVAELGVNTLNKSKHEGTLPHPSACGRRATTSPEMRGPPPARQPPRPPCHQADHDYTNDYEDPEEMQKQRDASRDLLLKTSTSSSTPYNSYEMSLSQQRRSGMNRASPMAPPLEPWSVEPAVLHKNADGAYYIPSGSMRTTSSTLSPASVGTAASSNRYHEQVHPLAASSYPDASATLLKHPNTTVTVTQSRRRLSKMPTTLEKKKKGVEGCLPAPWCSVLLGICLFVAIFIIVFLMFRTPSYVYTSPSPSAVDDSTMRYHDLNLRALPSVISLGERVYVDFLPKHMATTEIFIARAGRVAFNATVGSGAQLVLMARAGVAPSLSLHDALFSLRADRMGVENSLSHQIDEIGRSKRHVASESEILSPRSAAFEQFMLEGRHFLTFINERNRVEPLVLVASMAPPALLRPTSPGEHPLAAVLVCEANCNQRGECISGRCKCASGFSGEACEEAVCPIVCSGNGVFSGGICVCKSGFKGKECDVRSNWCEVPDCNGRGRCGDEGSCRCESGWTGDACEKKACPHATCNDRGVCANGTCFCADGWRGVDCLTFVDVIAAVIRKESDSQPEPPKRRHQTDAEAAQNIPVKATSPPDRSALMNAKVAPQPKNTSNVHVGPIFPTESVESTCGLLNFDGECWCGFVWNGNNCQKEECSSCMNGACDLNGKCNCWKGWIGEDCDVELCPIGCADHGKCGDDGVCQCDKGWNGGNCYQEGCKNECSGHGECVKDLLDEWYCRCQVGRRGADCAIPIELHCDDGLDNDNDGFTDCDDPECCSAKECVNESVCAETPSPTEVLLRMPPVINAHFAQRVNFLIKEKSVQSYTDPNQFNETLVAVIRGRVLWNGGASDSKSKSLVPLAGVRVSDATFPLYGFTLTRADGYFDLVVNGGRSVNLQFLRTQFQSVKQGIFVLAHEIVHIDDVVLGREKSQAVKLSPRAKCTPGSRNVHDLVLKSSWQHSSDGVEDPNWSGPRIVVDSRSIVEKISIPGSSLNLVYDSSRVSATNSTLLIGILGSDVDVELRIIYLVVDVAGRHFEFIMAPKVNLTHLFAWDRLNAYRQKEYGTVPVVVRVGYEYRGCDRDSEVVWLTRKTRVMGATSRKMEASAWTVNVHHHLDIVNNVVEFGNGGTRVLGKDEKGVEVVLGMDGRKRDIECTENCVGASEKVSLFRPSVLTFALDGSMLVGDHNLIRRVASDGTVNTVLVLSIADTSHPYYIAVSPVDGTVAVSLPLHKQVWKVVNLTPEDPQNNHEVLAGDGTACASAVDACGDGGLAADAQLIFNKGIAFDKSGTLYVADSRRLRIVDPSGHIRSVGDSSPDSHPECSLHMRVANLQMEWPTSVSVDLSSNLVYILDSNVVYEIDQTLDIARVALGSPTACANSTWTLPIRNAREISVGPDSSLYVVESDGKRVNQVRRLAPDRTSLELLVGGKSPCSCDVATCDCDDSLASSPISARNAHLNSPSSVTFDTSGVVFVADSGNAKVKRVYPRTAQYDPHMRLYKVVAGERNELFTFNRHGLHTSTVSLVTGKTLFNFTYNVDSSLGKLSAIHGSNGAVVVRMARSNDTHLEIETTNGERLQLTLSTYDGMLESVQWGNRDVSRLNFDANGLLKSRVDTATAVVFGYDDWGRANALRRNGENWEISPEKIVMGRITTTVTLNGEPHAVVKMREKDLSVEDFSGQPTKLIAMDEGFSLVASGMISLFDSQPSALHDEKTLLKRRTTVASLSNPTRRALTTRWNWRFTTKKDEMRRTSEVGTRPRINGVNMFSMEFDVTRSRDVLRGRHEEALLKFDYSDAGELRRVVEGDGATEDAYRMAEMNVTFDSLGRRSELQWGASRVQVTYDAQNRIVEKMHEGAYVPVKYSYSRSSRLPISVEQGGEKFTVKYDSHERLKEIVTPTGESHSFSSVSLGGDEWVLKRKFAFASKPSMLAVDRRGRLKEAVTPDGLHHVVVRRDAFSRITQVMNDGDNWRATCWTPAGDVHCTTSTSYSTNATLQGPLVAWFSIWRNTSGNVCVSSFSYEYDDLQRVTSVKVVADGTAVEPIQMSYDERTGRISTVNDFTLLHEPSMTRISGHGILSESSRDVYRRVVERKWIVGNARLSLSVLRDAVGRPVASEWKTPGGDVHTERVTFDAFGRVVAVEKGSEKTAIAYNGDGRVVKLNEQTMEWHSSGVPKKFGEEVYVVDANGWVTRRGNAHFFYDAYGRLVSGKSPTTTCTLTYDHLHRVVVISKNSEETSLFYANPELPMQVTHFVTSSAVSMIFYDDDGVPFALSGEEGRYAIATDQHHSLRFVLSQSGAVKSVERNIFGRITEDSKPEMWLPIGYLNGIEIPEMSVTILGGRPFDNFMGRYLSFSPAAAGRVSFSALPSTVDLFALEVEMNPFSVPRIPTDFETWFGLSSLSKSLLPTSQFGLPLPRTVAYRLLSAFPTKLLPFSHVQSVLPSPLIDPRGAELQPSDDIAWSIEDVGFSNLLVLSVVRNKTFVETLPNLNKDEVKIVESIINGAQLMRFRTWTAVHTAHLLSSASTTSLTSSSSPHFTLVASRDSAELRNGKSKIIVHFSNDQSLVRKKLQDELKTRESSMVWRAERKRIQNNEPANFPWTDSQKRELLSKGTVTGVDLAMKTSHESALFPSVHSWRFVVG